MPGPIHQARREICVSCEFWNEEEGRCHEVDADPSQFGADADKVALAPWVMRLDCEVWDEKEEQTHEQHP